MLYIASIVFFNVGIHVSFFAHSYFVIFFLLFVLIPWHPLRCPAEGSLPIYHESCAWTARDMGGLGATEKQLDAQTPLNECFVFFPLLHQSEHPPLFLGHLASFGSFRPPEPHILSYFHYFHWYDLLIFHLGWSPKKGQHKSQKLS